MFIRKLFLFLLFTNFIKTRQFFGFKNNSFFKNLRTLWEEKMVYEVNNPEEEDSLKHCASSSYKYFSFIQTGAPVTFDHTINQDNVVRIYNLINLI